MQIKNKKIGLLTPSLQSGGAERVISITSQILEEEGYEVYILIYDNEDISYSYSGEIINLKSKAGKNFISKILRRIQRIIKVSFYKYKYNLDTVVSFLYSANVVNYYSIGSAKRVMSCRGYTDYKLNAKNYSKFESKIDSFIVQTERMKNDFISDYNINKSKVEVVNNPFNIEQIDTKSKENIEPYYKKKFENSKVISTVGSFKQDKGYWHLIKAFTLVKETIPDAILLFIGHRGEMEQAIKDMGSNTDYPEDIIFMGYQENPFKYIAKSDLYICSSIHEGFPNSLVEAMACGVPVLSTDCNTGPREILQHSVSDFNKLESTYFTDYGILVPKLDENIDFNIENITDEERILAQGIVETISSKETLNKYKVKSKRRAREFDLNVYRENIHKWI